MLAPPEGVDRVYVVCTVSQSNVFLAQGTVAIR